MEGFRGDFSVPPGRDDSEGAVRAVMRVLITQIGFVISTVALPAKAPANMDSRVVSFLFARPVRMAPRAKRSRVHSYPSQSSYVSEFFQT